MPRCASGALWQAPARLLCVSDLHLGKSERIARRSGGLLPPYEVQDTLERLEAEIAATDPAIVVCLGDSFDDLDAAAVAGRGGTHLADAAAGRAAMGLDRGQPRSGAGRSGRQPSGEPDRLGADLSPYRTPQRGEVSGHYHPKLALGGAARPCFLIDADRVILPAFGAYTGGLRATSGPLRSLMGPGAIAVLTGRRALAVPLGG